VPRAHVGRFLVAFWNDGGRPQVSGRVRVFVRSRRVVIDGVVKLVDRRPTVDVTGTALARHRHVIVICNFSTFSHFCTHTHRVARKKSNLADWLLTRPIIWLGFTYIISGPPCTFRFVDISRRNLKLYAKCDPIYKQSTVPTTLLASFQFLKLTLHPSSTHFNEN